MISISWRAYAEMGGWLVAGGARRAGGALRNVASPLHDAGVAPDAERRVLAGTAYTQSSTMRARSRSPTHRRATVVGSENRRGPALPGLTSRRLPRCSITGMCE